MTWETTNYNRRPAHVALALTAWAAATTLVCAPGLILAWAGLSPVLLLPLLPLSAALFIAGTWRHNHPTHHVEQPTRKTLEQVR